MECLKALIERNKIEANTNDKVIFLGKSPTTRQQIGKAFKLSYALKFCWFRVTLLSLSSTTLLWTVNHIEKLLHIFTLVNQERKRRKIFIFFMITWRVLLLLHGEFKGSECFFLLSSCAFIIFSVSPKMT